MKSTRKAFDFVEISEVPPKPRKIGVIEIRGPYYAPTTIGYVKDLFEMWEIILTASNLLEGRCACFQLIW